MKKLQYEMPNFEVFAWTLMDVLTTSGEIWNGPDYEGGGEPGNNDDNTTPGDGWLDDDFWG